MVAASLLSAILASGGTVFVLERTGAFDGYMDGPGFQAAMDSVLDSLRAAIVRG